MESGPQVSRKRRGVGLIGATVPGPCRGLSKSPFRRSVFVSGTAELRSAGQLRRLSPLKGRGCKKRLDKLYCVIHSVYRILYGEWYCQFGSA